MNRIKVMSIFGTRPEAIKMAPLVRALEAEECIDSRVLITAQHREMLDQVLSIFEITPDHDLNLMQHGQTIVDLTSRVLYGVTEVLKQERPDLVLVHGDTTTTFAAALAAFYEQIPVGHVEAGLRTGNMYAPFPEELNRQLAGRLATDHFAPTAINQANLLKEGICPEQILVTGNTVIDALHYVIGKEYTFEEPLLAQLDFAKHRVITLTCHRRENWGEPMEQIFTAVKEIVQEYDDVRVVFPIHKNPSIRERAQRIFAGMEEIIIVEPLDYQPFSKLMSQSYLILSDSGGVQEEAPGLGKPVIVLREETERPEAVAAGTVRLGGITKESVKNSVRQLLDDPACYQKMARANNPYGDGTASAQIVSYIIEHYGKK